MDVRTVLCKKKTNDAGQSLDSKYANRTDFGSSQYKIRICIEKTMYFEIHKDKNSQIMDRKSWVTFKPKRFFS